jgi:predicted AlkP superfamily phosphohydrolase/phosphomutase
MDGGIAINEWLQREGYLTLSEQPTGVVPFDKVGIDWSKTRAWGAGGYYARVFLNVRGREPQGVIDPDDYEAVRDDLATRFEAMTDEQGHPLGTRVFKPQEVYRECRNIPPDLIVYFGDLAWRSVGSVGLGSVYTYENDTGPDDANHAQEGLFMLYQPSQNLGGRCLKGLNLLDIAPTVLDLMGIDVPRDMIGRVIQY